MSLDGKLYKSGVNLKEELVDFIIESEELFIFSAYIKLDALVYLIEGNDNIKAVYVRWQPRDLIVGVSDLEIYSYLKRKHIHLYRNSRIHLKAFVDSYKRCLVGSANISNIALGITGLKNHNYEIATLVSDFTLEDRLYFYRIEQESVLITDSIYQQLKEQLLYKKIEFQEENDFVFTQDVSDRYFLLSSLPMSYDINTLLAVYFQIGGSDEIELNCAMHDLALYDLSFGLTSEEFMVKLKCSFFNHPFIEAFLANLDEIGEIYFGAAKEWIHKNCKDVPLPRKWEITENIQILYRWIIALGDGKYSVNRPNYSERLFITKGMI